MALTDNLVAYWKLDESSGNAVDATGHGYTLTNGNSTAYATGKINNGADLEKDNSNYFKNSTNLGLSATGNQTFSIWTKIESANATNEQRVLLMAKIDGGAGSDCISPAIILNTTSGTTTWRFYDGSTGEPAAIYTSTPSTGTWYHIVCTREYNTTNGLKLYINGSLVAQATPSTPVTFTTHENHLNVGRWNDGATAIQYWDGVADELGVWSRSLTTAEIASLYNSGNGFAYPFSSTSASLTTRKSLLGVGI